MEKEGDSMGCCLPKIKYMGENDQEMEKKLEEARVIRDSQTMKLGAAGNKVVTHDDQLQPVGEPEVLPPLVPAEAHQESRGCCGVL